MEYKHEPVRARVAEEVAIAIGTSEERERERVRVRKKEKTTQLLEWNTKLGK